MSVTIAQLVSPQTISDAITAYYTSTNVKTRIDKLTVGNPSATARTVSLYLVPSGGSPSDANVITKTKSIAPGETWNCPDMIGQVLASGGTLRAVADLIAVLVLSAAGSVIT